jgi:hypothetical protein
VNPRLLLIRLENSGVAFSVEDGRLSVDAPRGLLTDDDKAALIESKADVIEVLERRERKLQAARRRGFVAAYSKEPGYIALHDPITGEWHDFPAASCLPSVVEEAKARSRRRKESRPA